MIVTVTITNHATESQTDDFDSQYLYDAAGRKFDADMDATIVLDDSNAYTDGVTPATASRSRSCSTCRRPRSPP